MKLISNLRGIIETLQESKLGLYLGYRGHKMYFAEIWKTEVESDGEGGGVVCGTDKIIVLLNNVREFIKFHKKYAICGSYGWLDTPEEIIKFFLKDLDKIISYQEWENLENKEYYLD